MKTVAIVLSIPLILEFVFAPVKLATAALLAAGLTVRDLSIAGVASALALSSLYIGRLLDRTRRDPAGLLGFMLFGALAAALLAVRLRP
jgi:hypothetical protein